MNVYLRQTSVRGTNLEALQTNTEFLTKNHN
uniref:Uncharacterized protein n=1 Tax=Arundo donax TaxID=35708 RepID=A0A0A9AIM5_ARUDO